MRTCILRRSLACLLAALLAAPLSQAAAAAQQSPDQQSQSTASQQPQLEARPQQDSNTNQKPETANRPVGTAAAPYENPTGISGTRPAGAVIAPAKQRRVHTIFVRIGIVAGAGAAIAAVALLSHGSPSQPH